MVSNVSKLTFLSGAPFYLITEKQEKIYFTTPTFGEYLSENDLMIFLGLVQLDLEKNKEVFEASNKKVTNINDALIFLIFNTHYKKVLVHYFKRFIKGIEITNAGFYVGSHRITNDELDFIIETILISLGSKELVETDPEAEAKEKERWESLSEMEQRFELAMKESEERLQKTKARLRDRDPTALDDIIMAIIKEFGLKLPDIMSLTIYVVMWYYSYIWKIDQHRLTTGLAGNGLLKDAKDYKYFTRI